MKRLRNLALTAVLAAALCTQGGCATLFRWERVGRPVSHQGDLDTGWLILHVLSLNLFGLATDLLTGAIYMNKGDRPWGRPE